jgi:hypothetical protein
LTFCTYTGQVGGVGLRKKEREKEINKERAKERDVSPNLAHR